jgi:hypothetical protein
MEATTTQPDQTRQRVALIQLTPEATERLRDPRIIIAIIAALIGAAAVFGGYLGISSTLDPGKQLPYLVSGGVGGLFLLGVAAVLFFSADVGSVHDDVRALSERIDVLTQEMARLTAELVAERAPEPEPVPTPPPARARRRL